MSKKLGKLIIGKTTNLNWCRISSIHSITTSQTYTFQRGWFNHQLVFLTAIEFRIIKQSSEAHRVELAVHEQAQRDICVPGAAIFLQPIAFEKKIYQAKGFLGIWIKMANSEHPRRFTGWILKNDGFWRGSGFPTWDGIQFQGRTGWTSGEFIPRLVSQNDRTCVVTCVVTCVLSQKSRSWGKKPFYPGRIHHVLV